MCNKKKYRMFNMNDYLKNNMPDELEEFSKNGKLKSGYKNIDLTTNLYPGLYVIGAISSLGKTTFMHQMCDQIASNGTPIIFFSLEQSALELASKSLSRILAMKDASSALTSLQIRNNGSDIRVSQATESYLQTAKNITIVECSFDCTIKDIEDSVTAFINNNEKKPFVVIDYLQVIKPLNPQKSQKENVDSHVHRLKQLQTKYNLALVVISSLNRQNYSTTIDFESFKESGGIEYTADVIWGLQLKAVHNLNSKNVTESREIIRKAKAANPREIEFVCLKNRFGISSYNCDFNYYPQYDYFVPIVPPSAESVTNIIPDLDGFIQTEIDFDMLGE